jgi:hypothetical protein
VRGLGGSSPPPAIVRKFCGTVCLAFGAVTYAHAASCAHTALSVRLQFYEGSKGEEICCELPRLKTALKQRGHVAAVTHARLAFCPRNTWIMSDARRSWSRAGCSHLSTKTN